MDQIRSATWVVRLVNNRNVNTWWMIERKKIMGAINPSERGRITTLET